MPEHKNIEIQTDLENQAEVVSITPQNATTPINRIVIERPPSDHGMPKCFETFLNKECYTMIVMSMVSLSVVSCSLFMLIRDSRYLDSSNIWTGLLTLTFGLWAPQPHSRR